MTNRLCTALFCACRTKKEVLCLTSTQPSRRGGHDIPATLTHTSLTCCSSWLPAQLGQSVPEYPRAEVAGLQGHGYTHRVSSASPYTQQKEWGLQQTDQPLFALRNSHQMKNSRHIAGKALAKLRIRNKHNDQVCQVFRTGLDLFIPNHSLKGKWSFPMKLPQVQTLPKGQITITN